jgi:hypothetical protein
MAYIEVVHTETDGAVTYRLYIEQDDTPVRGNAMASGDDAADKEAEGAILERLDAGDVWAWAFVTVEAQVDEFTAVDTLGGCCYRDTADFINGPYYADMKSEARRALGDTLVRATAALAKLAEAN